MSSDPLEAIAIVVVYWQLLIEKFTMQATIVSGLIADSF
jgi:hypothetical protein